MLVLLGISVVEGLAADGAESRAIGAAEQLRGQGEDERVGRPALGVEASVIDVRGEELLVAAARLVDLAGVDAGVEPGLLETAHAGSGEPCLVAEAQRVAAAGARNVEPRVS